jgi:simple sugar transport system substrate-binding protein
MSKRLWFLTSLFVLAAMLVSACAPTPTAVPTIPATAIPKATDTVEVVPTATAEPTQLVVGLLLVGPYNDRGWSQAHYDAGQYVMEKLSYVNVVHIDKVNPADRPGTSPDQLGEELLTQGAKVVIFNSDDMKDGAITFARAHPDIIVIHASGDSNWSAGKAYQDLPNLINVMGKMDYGKMMAGCAAALTTKTGQIGYLGPLINDETRRLASSVFLGAKYCWTEYLGKPAADLKFKVTWIGFWFNIPGVTADPTQVANDFFNAGYDVIVSGIDTTEGLVEANKAREAGQEVWAIPYDFRGACEGYDSVCLGVPYFNWGPSYVKYIQSVEDGTVQPTFDWIAPDWTDINNPDTSIVGFLEGAALSEDASLNLNVFIGELSAGTNLWVGPMNYQDGTVFLAEGAEATDLQIWYMPQLLEGMEGASE